MEWMLLPLRRYADFSGRSRRMEYWMFGLLNVIVYVVLAIVVFGVLGGAEAFMGSIDPNNPLAIYGAFFSGPALIFVAWWLVVLVPSLAVGVRRLHDRDLSGWWFLGFIVASMIPIIGFVASVAFLVFMFLPGTQGPNRFGPDPKDPSAGADTFS